MREEGLVVYFAFLIFVGWAIGDASMALLQFIPYWISGLVFLMPLYGFVKIQRRKSLNVSVKAKRFFQVKGRKTAVFVVVASMAYTMRNFGGLLANVAILSVVVMIVSGITWTVARAVLRNVKAVEIPTYYEVIKQCFTS